MQIVSIDNIIPAAQAEGCSEPATPINSQRFEDHHDNCFSISAACNLGCATHNQAQSVNTHRAGVGNIAGLSTVFNPLGNTYFNVRIKPRIDRYVTVPSRYLSPFKCITLRPAIDTMKAHAVWHKICTELKDKRDVIFWRDSFTRTCEEVAKSFRDGGLFYKSFMNYFIDCPRAEEENCRPLCVGFRVFLSGYLGEMLNHVEERELTMYPKLGAFLKIKADTDELDLNQVKLFFVLIREDNHYSVYCLNMMHSRIDILESSCEDRKTYHEVVGDRVVSRLNELFQQLTNGKFKDFSNCKRPITTITLQSDPNESAFVAMKGMEI